MVVLVVLMDKYRNSYCSRNGMNDNTACRNGDQPAATLDLQLAGAFYDVARMRAWDACDEVLRHTE